MNTNEFYYNGIILYKRENIYLERNIINFRNNRILTDADNQFDLYDLYDFYQSTSSFANHFNDYNDEEEDIIHL
ncbi:fam-b protein [Plasmodium vinckei]|uniref:Fam-b protein n=1 Tax=Plasmodium vinckei TaxID=5860 RepID=A0A6V7SG01_PLAVN|nr:fam-b protein [Plasmodium vinckei]